MGTDTLERLVLLWVHIWYISCNLAGGGLLVFCRPVGGMYKIRFSLSLSIEYFDEGVGLLMDE